jgi:alpha/beta superfamily hydrolase
MDVIIQTTSNQSIKQMSTYDFLTHQLAIAITADPDCERTGLDSHEAIQTISRQLVGRGNACAGSYFKSAGVKCKDDRTHAMKNKLRKKLAMRKKQKEAGN